MKRLHIHIGVKSLEESVMFYTTLFNSPPTKLKDDYAKWMLDDPRVNFAISTRSGEVGLDHLGIQVDEESQLSALKEQLKKSDLKLYSEGETTCCYAESNKAWVQDPAGIAWETYHTLADAEIFHKRADTHSTEESSCCIPDSEASQTKSSCC